MAYKDVLIPILEKWVNVATQYKARSVGSNLQKYTTAMLIYDVINEEIPEDALRILKFKRDFAKQEPREPKFLNIHMMDEGVEDAKKLMNYHNKFRKVSTKSRAYIDLDDRESKFRQSLMVMTDDQLYAECKRYVKLSAYAMNNPSSAYHTRVTNCFDECERRGKRKIYHEAYSEVKNELFGKERKILRKKKKITTRRKRKK
jgi:hypothetical protein